MAAALAASAGAGVALGSSGVATASASTLGRVDLRLVWQVNYTHDHNPFALSSPVLAELRDGPAAVVGDRSGHVYAVYLAPGKNGRAHGAWEVTARAPDGVVGIDSPPSSLDGVVYFGVGNRAQRGIGGYEAVDPSGAVKWERKAMNPASDAGDSGVSAGLTIASLQSQTSIVGPSQGQNTYLLDASSGKVLKGFPWFQADTVFATAAVADVEGNGQNQIIEDGNTTAGYVYHTQYINGGEVRIIGETGNHGDVDQPNGGLYCEYTVSQGVDSSAAVGEIFHGTPGIVFGTSTERTDRSTTDDVIAINPSCHKVWKTALSGPTTASPALADVLDDGGLQVLEGTQNGEVYCLDADTGRVIWKTQVPGEIFGGVVTADLGNGRQDVVVPTTAGAYLLAGRTGTMLQTIEKGVGLQNSPLVTRDPNGSIGITLAGYSGSRVTEHAVLQHFEIVGSDGSSVDAPGAWPEFHHDPRLTGDANVPAADNLNVSSKSLPTAVVGKHYEVSLRASGGRAPYQWRRIGGTRPPGLQLSANGTWKGTPGSHGVYHVSVEVSDRTGTKVKARLAIRIDG